MWAVNQAPPVRHPRVPLSLPVCLSSLNLDKQTAKGSSALHYCCLTDNSECLKLLLRGKASIEIGRRPPARDGQTDAVLCLLQNHLPLSL